ncbi:MAG: KilA-N domain-containing protein [Symploca sp. SIO2D2]|nr:KilA-N domain-containing protein [Symploca sp. SIO2D2]
MTDFTSSNFQYQGLSIRRQPGTGLVCLTDLWKAQCSPTKDRPLAWIRLELTQLLLKRLAEETGVVPVWSERKRKGNHSQRIITEIPGILETRSEEGKLLTYSSTELAVVYARFLSAECYEWALTTLAEGSEEEANLVEQMEQEAQLAQKRKVSRRRALIAAGWAVPVIAGVTLANKAVAAGSTVLHVDRSPHSDISGPHFDDPGAHFDSTHSDHTDGQNHIDQHSDGSTDHVDLTFSDSGFHSDETITHSDKSTHADSGPSPHNDSPSPPHNDFHNDHSDIFPHNDGIPRPHNDIFHNDSFT